MKNQNFEMHQTSIYCPDCFSITEAKVLHSYYWAEFLFDPEDNLHGNGTSVSLYKCIRCNRPFLIADDYRRIDGEEHIENSTLLCPSMSDIDLKNVPEIVKRPYLEAKSCFNVRAYDACTIMCRKGIEAICDQKGESRGALRKRLSNLLESKQIEESFFKWADQLRILGNDGAHNHTIIISEQDARDAIDFLESLILYLFNLATKYNDLISRRAQKP